MIEPSGSSSDFFVLPKTLLSVFLTFEPTFETNVFFLVKCLNGVGSGNDWIDDLRDGCIGASAVSRDCAGSSAGIGGNGAFRRGCIGGGSDFWDDLRDDLRDDVCDDLRDNFWGNFRDAGAGACCSNCAIKAIILSVTIL